MILPGENERALTARMQNALGPERPLAPQVRSMRIHGLRWSLFEYPHNKDLSIMGVSLWHPPFQRLPLTSLVNQKRAESRPARSLGREAAWLASGPGQGVIARLCQTFSGVSASSWYFFSTHPNADIIRHMQGPTL